MRFTSTPLEGVVVVEVAPVADVRGLFARTFCTDEFSANGLCSEFAQCSTSFNVKSGTIRGMHFQCTPHEEVKLVRCTRGIIYDVALDLRPDSPTFRKWFALELSQENRKALYIPKGFAHGFQTLSDQTEVFYHISTPYQAASSRGVRWNDPQFAISWPSMTPILSDRDAAYPDFSVGVR